MKLLKLGLISVFLVTNTTQASPPPPVINVDNTETTVVKNHARASAGTAIASAAGLCVNDWKPGWQKCIAWAAINVEHGSPVHGFGGGVTTRVDQFAVHVFAGLEDLEGDETTVLIGGSLNWR